MLQLLCLCRKACLLILLATPHFLFAQTKTDAARKRVLDDPKVSAVLVSAVRQTPAFISLKNRPDAYKPEQVKHVLNNYLAIRQGVDEARKEKETPKQSTTVQEYQQYYKGIKVDRARFKAFIHNGKLDFLNGAWYDVPATLQTSPALSRNQALSLAKNAIGARTYMPDLINNKIQETANPVVKQKLKEELIEYGYAGDLVIVKDFNKASVADVRLAYKFNLYAAEPLSRSWVYVDALDGKILLIDVIIKHANDPVSVNSVPTPVQTRYAGVRNIQVKRISGNDPHNGLPLVASNPLELYLPGSLTYVLIDDTRGNGVETYDLNGVGGLPLNIPALYAQGKSFTDVNNNWTLPEHKRGDAIESENDDIAWDAHWGAGIVYDYFKIKHNRLSYDGNNAKIKSFIHSGLAYDNAFWNGSVMTYGDGSGTAANGFKPLTSLDVCAHEIGHGVCEFTSDLVYAKESGAMNEALSDIWAACVEYYAIQNVDASLGSAYKPFYIGEQISVNPNSPLRRMDNPKAAGDPDTYGGLNWKSQDCSPTLANDQCGVHTNSGVLNKWFYLITVGSHSGSGPDAAFAGEDDGINDAVTTGPAELQHPANPYQVTGIGFAEAEKITYLMELMLTTTATYAEAREVSIAVATTLSGNPCSALVETVTNAWYAVGVGAKFIKPCVITYGFTQAGSSVLESTEANGCVASKVISIPVVMPANSTGSVSVSGTASNGIDFSNVTTSLSNPGNTTARKDVYLTVKNDGAIEGDEYIQLTLSLTNAGNNPVRNSYRLTILDDDVVPVIGTGERTLLTETFTRVDGFEDPAGWAEILELPEAPNGDPVAAGKNQWGIFDNKLAITGREGLTGTKLPNATYNNNSPSQTIIRSPLLDARGLSVITLKFDYTIQGEINAEGEIEDFERLPVFDYMAVAYSLDGVNFTELTSGGFFQYASVLPESGTITGNLPASLANKQFYLAFRWFNDTNAGGPYSVSIDNVLVKAASRTIENDLGHSSRENLSAGSDVYFYSTQDGQVLCNAKNTSGKDFGCTYVFVEKTGNGTFNLYQNNQGLHKVADKIIRIECATSIKATTTVTLFFTEAQLLGLESATGMNRSSFSVYHVQGISYGVASQSNTKKYAALYTEIPGIGGSYTVSFNEKPNGSYALGAQVSASGFALKEPGTIAGDENTLSVEALSPNPVQSSSFVLVDAPHAQMLMLEIANEMNQHLQAWTVQVAKGRSQLPIRTNTLRPGKYALVIKDEKGRIIQSQVFIKQ